jgi:hypothetical protein
MSKHSPKRQISGVKAGIRPDTAQGHRQVKDEGKADTVRQKAYNPRGEVRHILERRALGRHNHIGK